MKKFKIAIIALMTASLLLTAISFAYLNDVIPLHFGVNGQPDYYGSKYWLLLLNAIAIVSGVAQIAYCQYSNATENYKKQLLLTGTIIQVVFLVIFGAMIAYAWSYSEEVQAFDSLTLFHHQPGSQDTIQPPGKKCYAVVIFHGSLIDANRRSGKCSLAPGELFCYLIPTKPTGRYL